MKLKAFWLVIKVAGKNMNGLYFLVEHQKKTKNEQNLSNSSNWQSKTL